MIIENRIVVHFPGFEPLDAQDHRDRYERSAMQSGEVWSAMFQTGKLEGNAFSVNGKGVNWTVDSRISILDHDQLITDLRSPSIGKQIWLGFQAAFRVVGEGGMAGYFRNAWRFGLFFIFPFLFVFTALMLAASLAVLPFALNLSPLHCLWSLPAGFIVFSKLFLPFSEKLHTLHLFADWRLAVRAARLDDERTNQWIEAAAKSLKTAFESEADEYLITAHSMGASLALHALGKVLENDPTRFNGKRVVFATLGGAALQCALLKSAGVLRDRLHRVAECPDILWFEVQSLTDPVHLYRARTVAAAGFASARQPQIVPFRFRTVLSESRYRRIKTDILRMHRQYVLGPDRRGSFDFTLMTAGPLPASLYRTFTQQHLPPIDADGSVRMQP